MASTYHCIECSGIVTNRMHAVSCDGCERWQHRRCNTGITSAEYALMKKGALNIKWHCRRCQTFDHIPLSPPVSPTSVRELSSTLVRSDESESNMNVDVDNNSVTIEDRTFDIGDRDFQRPEEPKDESILDPPLDNVVPEDVPTTYEVVESGSKRGGRKLVSSDGYTYTVRRTDGHRTYWTCSKRGKTMKCYASVKQFADVFTPSTNGHQHPADPGALKKVKIAAKVKAVARENVFRPAGNIVESVMKDMITDDDFQLPKPENLTRAANLHRQKLRPAEPTDLNFEIDTSFIGEEFLLDDVRVDDQRHIILSTKEQLHHLSEARRWFVDGTFKIVKRPFYQLLSIHAFVKKEDDAKQVLLVYVLMSRRSKQDYVAVFQSIRSRLQQILVELFMLDFEAATWQAIREVFPGCVVKGCVFHWNQRVYRKILNVGLATAYNTRGDKFTYLRKLMALPYLPAEHILASFDHLQQQAQEVGGPILQVVEYVQSTWINGTLWKPENWSVFRQTVRTNNDVEGWHRRINTKAGRSDLGFYVLVPLLRGESQTVDLQIRLVSEHLLTRLHRKRYRQIHGRLFDAWDKYEDDDMTTTQLLRVCSMITGLGPVPSSDPIHEEQ